MLQLLYETTKNGDNMTRITVIVYTKSPLHSKNGVCCYNCFMKTLSKYHYLVLSDSCNLTVSLTKCYLEKSITLCSCLFTDSELIFPILQLVSRKNNTFHIDVVYNNKTVEDYNITVVSLHNPLFRVTLNNSQLRLFTGTDSRYNFTVDYRICSILHNTHYTLGKLWLTLNFKEFYYSLK